ncbi:MAG: hypothetical protein IPK94_20370 [Saprospiraceae bacterium]|nr:hypothetical protein [Saprospiraceae bacterium]MBK8282425.1 hypothetical protein [Saprospiraceae bacterium]MBK9932497.1 hypothetical protein [Saprospiraceae bacterium]MBP8094900.1 hypothetical protein [Saprospiraceae bacterium]
MAKSIICILFFCGYALLPAQDPGPLFMAKDQMYQDRNPAMPYPKKNIIGLPEMRGQIYSETGTLNDWNRKNPDGTQSIYLQDIWKSLERKDYTTEAGFSIKSFSFGKKYDRWQFNLSHRIRGDVDFTYNKDLVGLVAYGNYGLLNVEPLAMTQVLDLRPRLSTSLYQSLGIEAAYFINDQWSLGIGADYLAGWYEVDAKVRKFDLDIHDPLTISAKEDWTLRSADLIQSVSIDSFNVKYDGQALGKHPGAAFAVGLFHHTSQWQFGLQVRDLGWISWEGKAYSRKAETNYSGLQVNDFLNVDGGIFDHIKDTLRTLTNVDESNIKYRTSLQSRIILDAQYHLSDRWSGGGAIYMVNNAPATYWRVMAGTVYRPSQVFEFGGDISLDSYHKINLGLFGALRLSIFNIYMSMEHLPGFFNPNGTSRLGGSMGINLMWGE